jgi:hypothetical protein
VSYKPIPPPAWLLLPGEQLLEQPFHAADLPEMFKLDPSARCSCGSDQGINLTVDDIVIFTTATAVLRKIETTYCILCSNKDELDLICVSLGCSIGIIVLHFLTN